jgi:hypothetical protein
VPHPAHPVGSREGLELEGPLAQGLDGAPVLVLVVEEVMRT